MYVLIYNRLPQEVVDCDTVSKFQKMLTHRAKTKAQHDEGIAWRGAFQSCANIWNMFGSDLGAR